MNRILPLLRKDVKHLAPQTAVLWALMALACYSDYNGEYAIPLTTRMILQVIAVLSPLLCAALVVIAIQQESLIGDRQYWLTRPFTTRDLLGSKLGFILLAINVPLFAFQAASMALHGLPPYLHLHELVWRQVVFTALFVAIPAALAVITRTPGHALTTILLTILAWFLEMLLIEQLGPQGPGWADWISIAAVAILSVSLGAVIVSLQYRRRQPAIPRALFGCLILLCIPAFVFAQAAVWLIQPRLSTRQIAPEQLQISFEARREAPPQYKHRVPSFVQLEIPIRISDLRNSDRLVLNRLQFTPSLPASSIGEWAGNGWISDNTIHDVADGAGWLRLFVEAASYARVGGRPIDLRGTADVTLFVQTQTVESRRTRVELNDVGVCRPYPDGCVTALPRASVEEWAGQQFYYLVTPTQSYSPFPTNLLLNPVQGFAAPPDTLVVRKPVAWFTRTFECKNIRLADYVR